jgi:hypothetical protein
VNEYRLAFFFADFLSNVRLYWQFVSAFYQSMNELRSRQKHVSNGTHFKLRMQILLDSVADLD